MESVSREALENATQNGKGGKREGGGRAGSHCSFAHRLSGPGRVLPGGASADNKPQS